VGKERADLEGEKEAVMEETRVRKRTIDEVRRRDLVMQYGRREQAELS
jgi:hypothetical protein